MKLNLHTIVHELDDIVIGEIIGSDPNKPSIEYPVLFSVNEYHFYNNVLYVTIDKHLEEAKDRVQRYLSRNPNLSFSCICIGTPPSYTGAIPNCDIAWVDSSQSRTRLFNTIQKIFQRFTSWERGLEEIVNGGGGLSDLVNASLGIFKNDICITDQFSRVLVHRVYRTGQLLREQTDQIEEGKYLPKNMVFDGVLDEQGGMDFSSQEPTFATMHAFRCTVLRSTIKVSQGYSLILSVHSNYQEIGPYDCAPSLFLRLRSKSSIRRTGYSTATSATSTCARRCDRSYRVKTFPIPCSSNALSRSIGAGKPTNSSASASISYPPCASKTAFS